jgi:thymidylate synthase (FAD)
VKIIEPSFELQTPWGKLLPPDGRKLLRWIEYNARISHRAEEAQTEDSWIRFIKAVVLEHGDWSVVEHASVTAILRVDRGVTHELVRHRLFSFTQESTRFVNYKKKGDIEVILPEGLSDDEHEFTLWRDSAAQSCWTYMNLLDRKVPPQAARSVLPTALAATISVTGNLRNWRHFFLMRTSKETHPDFKRVTIPMLAEFQKLIPLLYDDIVPNQRQIDNLRLPR